MYPEAAKQTQNAAAMARAEWISLRRNSSRWSRKTSAGLLVLRVHCSSYLSLRKDRPGRLAKKNWLTVSPRSNTVSLDGNQSVAQRDAGAGCVQTIHQKLNPMFLLRLRFHCGCFSARGRGLR